jgi:uncharacterized membrane-anchored protein
MPSSHAIAPSRQLLNKVPEVTLYFWIVKVLCTTVGESAADYLNVSLNLGLTGVSVVTGVLLILALVAQFRADRYQPGRYWLTVALVSVFGTLVTDNLTDNLGVPLETSTIIFAVLLTLTFLAWYRSEKTLSIHSIITARREVFYWTAILVTFALGTATGDLMAEVLGLGYLVTGTIVAALIAVMAIGWRAGLNPVLAFWFIYILTRPLGASIGDYLSQPASLGGLGLGATVTSLIFVVGIIGIVGYLAVTKADVIPTAAVGRDDATERGGLWQTGAVVAIVVVAGATGYALRTSALQSDTASPAAQTAVPAPAAGSVGPATHISPLGDLSVFRNTTQNMLSLLNAGDQSGATAGADDLEVEWDDAEARLKRKDKAAWTDIDGKIDTALREMRAATPNPTTEKPALTTLLGALS